MPTYMMPPSKQTSGNVSTFDVMSMTAFAFMRQSSSSYTYGAICQKLTGSMSSSLRTGYLSLLSGS